MTRDSRLFLGLHPSMIADVLTDNQDLFKCPIWSSGVLVEKVNGTISPIDPTNTPKGVRYDSSHDP